MPNNNEGSFIRSQHPTTISYRDLTVTLFD
jgi:hypothetical protein